MVSRTTAKHLRNAVANLNDHAQKLRKDVTFDLDNAYNRWALVYHVGSSTGHSTVSSYLPLGQLYEVITSMNSMFYVLAQKRTERLFYTDSPAFDLAEARALVAAGCICHFAGPQECWRSTELGHSYFHALRMRELLFDDPQNEE